MKKSDNMLQSFGLSSTYKLQSHLSVFKLEEHIMRLREELDREREERNYFQLERDKIHSFWEITVRKQKEVDSELQKVEKDVEENEARHQLDVKVRFY